MGPRCMPRKPWGSRWTNARGQSHASPHRLMVMLGSPALNGMNPRHHLQKGGELATALLEVLVLKI